MRIWVLRGTLFRPLPPAIVNFNENWGFNDEHFFVPGDTVLNGVFDVSPGQSAIWSEGNFSDIGLSWLTATPTTVWDNTNASGTDGSV